MKTFIQQGDIYKIGDHTIACGDALDNGFVSKVIGDKKIRCILSDPPFGVAYVEGKKDLNQKLGVDSNKVSENDLVDPFRHRLNESVCGKCNGDCQYDSDGNTLPNPNTTAEAGA